MHILRSLLVCSAMALAANTPASPARADKAQEAEAVYRADLVCYPANGWSLLGLQRALAAQGKSAQAKAR